MLYLPMYHELHTILLQNYREIHYNSSTKYYFGLKHNFHHSYKQQFELKHNFHYSYKHQLQSPQVLKNLVQYRSFYVYGAFHVRSFRNAPYKWSFNIVPILMKLRSKIMFELRIIFKIDFLRNFVGESYPTHNISSC